MHPLEDFLDTGLLWIINREVLHPRGFALGIARPDPQHGQPDAVWTILFDGTETVSYGPDDTVSNQQRADALNALLDACRPALNAPRVGPPIEA